MPDNRVTNPPKESTVGLGDYERIAKMFLAQQQAALQSRVPDAAQLEAQSSARIAELLNPPQLFPDVSRRAAELGAARGVPGSAAAWGTGLRMTDEERLRRIALGQNMLTEALGRNPLTVPDITNFFITPQKQAELNEQRHATNTEAQVKRELGAGGGGQPSAGWSGPVGNYKDYGWYLSQGYSPGFAQLYSGGQPYGRWV